MDIQESRNHKKVVDCLLGIKDKNLMRIDVKSKRELQKWSISHDLQRWYGAQNFLRLVRHKLKRVDMQYTLWTVIIYDIIMTL